MPLESDQSIAYKQEKREARKPAGRFWSELGLITKVVMHQQDDRSLTDDHITNFFALVYVPIFPHRDTEVTDCTGQTCTVQYVHTYSNRAVHV